MVAFGPIVIKGTQMYSSSQANKIKILVFQNLDFSRNKLYREITKKPQKVEINNFLKLKSNKEL